MTGTLHTNVPFRLRTLCALALLFITATPAWAQTADLRSASEAEIKAVYLYNFLQFTSWPEATDAHAPGMVVIGILGEDPFGSAFDAVAGKPVGGGARLHITKLDRHAPPEHLRSCQLLFISASEQAYFSDIISQLHDAPVLTVGDAEGFLEAGGMIRLVRVGGDKIRWEINHPAVEGASLRLSAQLYQSAVRIMRGAGSGGT